MMVRRSTFLPILVLLALCLTVNEVCGFTTKRRYGLSLTRNLVKNNDRRDSRRRLGRDGPFPLLRLRVVLPDAQDGDYKYNNKEEEDGTNGFFIRPSIPADVGRASKILADGFFKHKTNFLVYQWERLETYLSLDSTFPKPNTLHQIFVACDSQSGRVLGMVEVDARVPKSNPLQGLVVSKNKAKDEGTRTAPPSPYMCNIAVDEKYQRRGIASALIRRCERQVEEWYVATRGKISCSLYLRVRESNTAAVNMYTKLNYTSILQEKDKKTGENLLVMRKELQRRLKSEIVIEELSDTADNVLVKVADVANP